MRGSVTVHGVVFVGYKNAPKAGLYSTSNTQKYGPSKNGGDILRIRTDERSDYTKDAAADHEPSSSENVAQSADESKTNTAAEGLDNRNERKVWVRTQIIVDDGNGVGRKNVSYEV